ncbi:MAG TPA: NAD(P)H-binding protein, partial [Cytophagaceae bacterium]|nr:NAD(P)H-binding protein [Cytophagaceae bacterium]
MEKKLNVLVTGASGTVGQEVLKNLFLNYHIYNTTVFDAPTEHAQHVFKRYKNSIQVVYGDIAISKDIEKACYNQDVVIHLSSIPPSLLDKQKEATSTVAQHLINGLLRHSPHAFLIFASSISVYGDRLNNAFIKTSDILKPGLTDAYAQQALETEQYIQSSKLDWAVFRL